MGCECLVGLVEMGEGGGPERSLMPPCTKEPPSPALQQCESQYSSPMSLSLSLSLSANDLNLLANNVSLILFIIKEPSCIGDNLQSVTLSPAFLP